MTPRRPVIDWMTIRDCSCKGTGCIESDYAPGTFYPCANCNPDWCRMTQPPRCGFAECFRVLRDHGTLVFKWNEHDVPLSQILPLAPFPPLIGNRGGRAAKSHWLVFLKDGAA